MSFENDQYLWLEDIEGVEALDWVKQENEKTLEHFNKNPYFQDFVKINEAVLNSKDRLAAPVILNGDVHNLWKDETSIRGLWRKTSIEKYKSGQFEWEEVLDFDALAEQENENWVIKSLSEFSYSPCERRAILGLSRGGKDACVYREFDIENKRFVKDGLCLPEAKGSVSWVNQDTFIVATDFGKGSLTESGYPRQMKLLNRGDKLEQAQLVFETEADKTGIWPEKITWENQVYNILIVVLNCNEREHYLYHEGILRKITVPWEVYFEGSACGHMVFEVKEDWTHGGEIFRQGGLASISISSIIAEGHLEVNTVLEASDNLSVGEGMCSNMDSLFVPVMENIEGKILKFQFIQGSWTQTELELPKSGSVIPISVNHFGQEACFVYTGFLDPSSLYFADEAGVKKLGSLPEDFDSSKFQVQQKFAQSNDGTKIPYYLISSKDTVPNGKNPTIIYGYGGFEISLTPWYLRLTGKNWLEHGGSFVVANIRGGGEFGPKWHQAALKMNREICVQDFTCVAKDLIGTNHSSPRHIGIWGGSNGGLLTGASFVKHPELFNASCTVVPLLDMLRYHKLLAGASWMGEYGDPEVQEEREFLKSFSPYHNISEQKKYPKVFLMTSTKDDRVHPGHARKMAAKMKDQGHDLHYYENTEGGHAGNSNNKQLAQWMALEMTYFIEQLM